MSPQHRILIVDDEPKVAFFFQKHLEMIDEAYTVAVVNSGEEALIELKRNRYDLIITDLRMPRMTGLELLNEVRMISPETKTILVTAFGSKEVWEEAERLNTFRALSKPLRIPDLLAAVREALQQGLAKKGQKQTRVVAFTGESYKGLHQAIESLRVNLGARTTILSDTAGRVLVSCGDIEVMDMSTAMALLGGTIAASNALAAQLNYPKPTHLSYFEGPPYDLYATNVSEDFFLTIVQDRRKEASRIGLVWLYAQRALTEIAPLLEGNEDGLERLLETGFAASVQTGFDELFGEMGMADPSEKVAAPLMARKSGMLRRKLEQMLTRFQEQTKIHTAVTLSEQLTTDDSAVANLILRLTAECLKNVYKHARATSVRVEIEQDGDVILGQIADNGLGFDAQKLLRDGSNNLAQLQEAFHGRAGTLVVSAYPDHGTNVTFQLPVSASVLTPA